MRKIVNFLQQFWMLFQKPNDEVESKTQPYTAVTRHSELQRAREQSAAYAAVIADHYLSTGWVPRGFALCDAYYPGIVEVSLWNQGTPNALWVACRVTGENKSRKSEVSGVAFIARTEKEHEAIFTLLREGKWTPYGHTLTEREMQGMIKTLPL